MRDQIASDIRGWDAIRDHRTGTAGDAATAEWLAGLAGAAGVEPHIDAFPFARRVPHECRHRGGGAAGGAAAGLPLFDGGLTDAAGLTGPLTGLTDGSGGIAVARYESSGGAATEALLRARKSDRHAAIVAVAEGRHVEPGLAPINADAYRRAVRAARAAGRQRTRGLARRRRRARRKRPSDGAYEHRADRRAQRAGAHRGGAAGAGAARDHDADQRLVDLHGGAGGGRRRVAGVPASLRGRASRSRRDLRGQHGARAGPRGPGPLPAREPGPRGRRARMDPSGGELRRPRRCGATSRRRTRNCCGWARRR